MTLLNQHTDRRKVLRLGMRMSAGLGLSGLLCSTHAAAQNPAPPKNAGSREIKWEDLVPKDWDPMKGARDKNIALLSDADPRTAKILQDLREAWDNAPTVVALNGAHILLPGYLVPLDEIKGELREFLLVPYFGACIHTPPPPANQIVQVKLAKPAKGYRSMDTVWVEGTLHAARADSHMGVSGYRLEGALVSRYTARAP